MTEMDVRNEFLTVARSFLGYSEADGRHKSIIDIYNGHEPLAQSYKVKYTDAWCATFVSAVAITAGMTSIIPTECSCPRQITLWQKMNRWEEDESYVPQPGDILYYAWKDSDNYAVTDNRNVAEHVGIVESVTGKTATIIEGNYQDSVGRRKISINTKYLRGYAKPDFGSFIKEDPNTMEYVIKPKKIAIYSNTKGLTMAQIKKETGCTAIMNGGLFNGSFKPVCRLKVGGKVLADDGYKYWGFGWNGDGKSVVMTEDMGKFDNYICCVCMVRDFVAEQMYVNADMKGARQRTALGLMDDGFVWMYCTQNGTTPEQLQKIAIAAGCKNAIMLDGGASTQCVFPHGTLKSKTRPLVQNYILVWVGDDEPPIEEKPDSNAGQTDICPYAEPTANLRMGSKGEGVKWLQWMLNKVGANLTVDGDFGAQTYVALNTFQFNNNLERDGICGPATRAKLKAQAPAKNDICPYAEPIVNLKKGAKSEGVKWLQWHLRKVGSTLEIDGEFGNITDTALRAFQSIRGLAVDGVCGPATRTALKEAAL